MEFAPVESHPILKDVYKYAITVFKTVDVDEKRQKRASYSGTNKQPACTILARYQNVNQKSSRT